MIRVSHEPVIRRFTALAAPIATLTLALGCPASEPREDNLSLGSASATLSGTSNSGQTASGSGDAEDASSTMNDASATVAADSSSDDSPIKFDLEPLDIVVRPTEGCEKIDFVFSVDNSCSTEDDQATLQQAFSQFLQLIRDNVQGQDHHIIIVDSDGDPTWACEFGAAQCCPDFVQGSHNFSACDLAMGAGVIAPYGGNASNMDCGIPAGRRYMTGDDVGLEAMFACAAQVGTSGNFSEFPVSAAVMALENPNNCNDGFLRDDAILVMTVITDDHDGDFGNAGDAELGDPNDWYQRVVAAKNGDEDASVFIGLTSNHCMGPPVPPIAQIVTLFGDQGVQGSHCSLAEMLDSFEAAVQTIDSTCNDFVPT